MQRVNLYTEQGGITLNTGGISSSTKVMGVFPGATVSVFNQGTLVLSTIFSDNGITPKSNPFTSDSITGLGFFLAANGHYDLQFSGTGFSTFTLADIILNDPADANTLGSLTVTGNATVGGTLGVTGITTLKQLGLVRYADQFAGADMGAKIQAAINSLPSGANTSSGGIIDATSFVGDQTWVSTLTMGAGNQCITLKLGIVRIISQQNPVISVPVNVSCNIFGTGCQGGGTGLGGGTQIAHNGAANDCIVWGGSGGTCQNVSFSSASSGVTLFVKATAASNKGAGLNLFQNLFFSGPGTGVAGSTGIRLQSNSATELATENTFTEVNLLGYADAIKMTTTGTQGPTDNWFNGFSILGGSPGGNGVNIQSGDINWFTGGIIASCTTGIITGATATQNAFAVRLESNTANINNAGIGTMFVPANMDTNTITDTGTNTVILGAAQVGILQKLGNGGGFQMNAPISIGQPPQTGTALFIQPLQTLTTGTQVGIQAVPQTSSAATGTGIGIRARADTAAAAFTQALNQGLRVDTPTVGAGSAITEWDGIFIDVAPTAGTKFAIKSNAVAPAQFADYVQSKRLRANQGTAYSGADAAIVINASWGTTATKSAATGFDQAFQFTVNSAGTGQAASPTIVITFKDGTWTNVPIVDVSRNDNATPTTSTFFPVWTTTATVLTITMNGTPTAGQSYIFTVMVFGT